MIIGKFIRIATAALLVSLPLIMPAPGSAAESSKIAVLAFGLFGGQSVFESEAKGAASIVAQRLGAIPVAVRANTKTRADVTVASIADALRSAAEHLDHDHDVLILVLTSHGSPDGVAVQAGRRTEILSPPVLAGMLEGTGMRHRVVIISACYSGVFLPALADDDTLVITAADAEHSSFGCRDKVKWTYFGDAFFNIALRHTADLRQAFAEARRTVLRRELHYHLVPSNPQIAGGKNVDLLLEERHGTEAADGQR